MLRQLRIEKNLTQTQLGKIFNVSKTTICQWETFRQEPCLDDVTTAALFFNVTADYLLGLENEYGAKTYIDNSFNNSNISGNIKL